MSKAISTILIIISITASAQEVQFSQYYAASLYLNPAFGGVYNDPSLHFNHKRQLQNPEIINELTQVSLNFPIKSGDALGQTLGGLGVMAFNEKSLFRGIYERNAAFINYSHNLKFGLLSSYLISLGLQAGYEVRKLNFSNLSWGSQYNDFFGYDNTLSAPVSTFNDQQQNMVFNAGFMYYYNPQRDYLVHKFSAFFGISATNLNRPNTSFIVDATNRAPMLLKYNGGIEFKANKLFVTPSLLYFYIRETQQFNAGLNMAYVPNADEYSAKGTQLLFGTWYRLRDAFVFMGGIRVNQLTVRASYDTNSNWFISEKRVDLAQNSMEISLQYSFSGKTDIRKASNPLF